MQVVACGGANKCEALHVAYTSICKGMVYVCCCILLAPIDICLSEVYNEVMKQAQNTEGLTLRLTEGLTVKHIHVILSV